jgi:predicted ester cyclase
MAPLNTAADYTLRGTRDASLCSQEEVKNMLEILTKSLEDFTAGRWDGVKASVTNDVLYEEPLASGAGVDKSLAILQGWRRAFPDVKGTVLGGFASGDHLVAEVEWTGTNTGPIETPFGTIPATNKRVTEKACLVCVVKDGKISAQHHYFDLFALFTQLGIAPRLATTPAVKTKAATPTA